MPRRPISAASLQQQRSRRRIWFWAGMFLLALPLMAIAALGVLYAGARYVPPPDAEPVDTSPVAARRAETRIAETQKTLKKAQADTQQGKKRPYRIAVKQEEINTLLRTSPRIRKAVEKRKIQRPFVRIENGRLRAGALVTYRKKPVYVTAEGPVTVGDKGQVSFRPEKVWVGRVKAPAALTKELSERAAKLMASGALMLPGQVQSVRLENGQIVIEGTTGGSGGKAAASPSSGSGAGADSTAAAAVASQPASLPAFTPAPSSAGR